MKRNSRARGMKILFTLSLLREYLQQTILFLYLRGETRPIPAPRYFSRGKLHYGVIARDESPPSRPPPVSL